MTDGTSDVRNCDILSVGGNCAGNMLHLSVNYIEMFNAVFKTAVTIKRES